jgi:hypothetical protein
MNRIDWGCLDLEAMYADTPSLVEIARRIGSTPGAVGYQLYKRGVKLVGDKLRFGCDRDRQARMAELYVLSKLNGAIDHNAEQFQPEVDITYRGARIDVKSSVLQRVGHHVSLSFMVEKHPGQVDLFVCLGYVRHGDDEPIAVYVIPGNEAPRWSIRIPLTGHARYERFKVRFPSMLKSRIDKEVRQLVKSGRLEQAHGARQ